MKLTILGESTVKVAVDAVVAVDEDVICELFGAGVVVVDEGFVEREVERVVNYAASVENFLVGV